MAHIAWTYVFLRDWQLAASSVVSRASDADCAVKHARLHAPGRQAWCPEEGRENEWILVDLGVKSEVAAVMTQGRDKKGAQAWVTHYFISYSEDAYRWDWARGIYGVKKVINCDGTYILRVMTGQNQFKGLTTPL